MPERFLLDQNFPAPIMDIAAIDKTVEYVALKTFDPSLALKQTPDWLILIRAAESGSFTGMVTRDASQLEDPEELVVLMDTGLTAVTWANAIEDPIKEWGQLLTYMPLVLRRRTQEGDRVFLLPKPRLGKGNVRNPRALLGHLASRQGESFPQVRDEARSVMKSECNDRGLAHLGALLGR